MQEAKDLVEKLRLGALCKEMIEAASLIERQAAEIEALKGAHVPAAEDIDLQEWVGMDGAIAFHLIDRHGDNWSHIGRLMHAWRDANSIPPAEIEALRMQAEWAPIETAPKDGTEIALLFPAEATVLGKSHGRVRAASWCGDWTIPYMSHNRPTHWMPLPSAPEARSKE